MKKITALALMLVIAAALLTGCGSKATIALITPDNEASLSSFSKSAWEGIVKYAEEHSISKAYYTPENPNDTASVEKTLDEAIKKDAKFIVLPGYQFSQAVYNYQAKYPDIKFVIVDNTPSGADGTQDIAQNTVALSYNEEEAGFMAGYAAVNEGYTQLGFLGGEEVRSVIRYGYGFLQGAEYAAAQLSLPAGSIHVKYTYAGSFDASDSVTQLVSKWYESGTECVFAAAGQANASVIAASDAMGGKVIGCDSDQSEDSITVISSAIKCIDNSVYSLLDDYYAGAFPGGQLVTMDVTNGGVALSMDTSKFAVFTQEQYDDLFARLMSNTDNITTNIIADTDDAGAVIDISALKLSAVAVEQVAI